MPSACHSTDMQGKLITAARSLLGWSQDRLAERARISRKTLIGMERDGNPTRLSEEKVVRVLEGEGCVFTENGEGVGVFLRNQR